VVEPLPPILVALAKRLVRWGVLPKGKEPDMAIINIYEVDDCMPPHVEHQDFDRPFAFLSLLSEQSIMFGSSLVPLAPGEFGGSDCEIPLPVGRPLSS
jgi:alkylated DNA repair protein alkB family protein 5